MKKIWYVLGAVFILFWIVFFLYQMIGGLYLSAYPFKHIWGVPDISNVGNTLCGDYKQIAGYCCKSEEQFLTGNCNN